MVLCGSGVAQFIVPSLTNRLVEAQGWRMGYVWLAVIWCAVVLPLVLLFLRNGAHAASNPGKPAHDIPPEQLPGYTVRQGFASPKFHRMLLGAFASTFFGAALMLNLVPILRSTGLSGATAAAVAGMMGFSIAGRFGSGWLLDRFSAAVVASTTCLIMLLLPALLLLVPGSVPVAMFAVFSFGVMGGALLPAQAYLTSRHFGPRSFGTFYGTINAIHSIGVGVGPLLANYLYDRTGSYRPTLIAAIPLFALGALLLGTLGRYPEFETPAKAG